MSNPSVKHFLSSTKSIVTWMKILGLDLSRRNLSSRCSCFLFHLLWCAIMGAICYTNYEVFCRMLNETSSSIFSGEKRAFSTERKRILIIQFETGFMQAVFIVFSIVPYFCLFICTINGAWKKLWDTLLEIVKGFNLCDRKFYLQIRRNCFTGLAMLLLVRQLGKTIRLKHCTKLIFFRIFWLKYY